MSEIFIEEENTVYEMDEECLRQKSQELCEQENVTYEAQGSRQGISWILLLLIVCICK